MADLPKLLRLRRMEEKLAEEQLLEARIALGRVAALEQALEAGSREAERCGLVDFVAGGVQEIRHDPACWQLPLSTAAIAARLAAQRAAVQTLSAAYADAHQLRRRLEVLLEGRLRWRRERDRRREQRQRDDAHLVARARAHQKEADDPDAATTN